MSISPIKHGFNEYGALVALLQICWLLRRRCPLPSLATPSQDSCLLIQSSHSYFIYPSYQLSVVANKMEVIQGEPLSTMLPTQCAQADLRTDYALPFYSFVSNLLSASKPLANAGYYTLERLYYHLLANPDPQSLLVALCVVVMTFLAARMWLRYLIAQITFFFWMAIYGGIIVTAVWLWARGLDGAMQDGKYLSDYWHQQYEFYERGRRMQQQQNHFRW